MRVIGRIGVVIALCVGREDDERDWAVAFGSLVPGNEENPAAAIGGRVEDHGDGFLEPFIALGDRAAAATVVHVVAQVRGDEVVPGLFVVLKIMRKLCKWPNVRDALGG